MLQVDSKRKRTPNLDERGESWPAILGVFLGSPILTCAKTGSLAGLCNIQAL